MAEEPAAQMSEEDQTMLRLFRCLDDSDQGEILHSCLLLLAGKRAGGDGNEAATDRSELGASKTISGESAARALEDLVSSLLPLGINLPSIALDNLGDPGAWLRGKLEEVPFDLFGVPFDFDEISRILAEDYLTEMREKGFPIPSDFNDDLKTSENEMWHPQDEEDATEDFDRFLRTWRRNILELLEKGDK